LAFGILRWAQGPEGSIILQGNYSFGVPGSNCTVLRQYYVTDKIVTINVAGRNVTFGPEEVKISLLLVCPWREQLQKLLHAGPSDPLYLRARQSKFRFKLDIYFSSSFASYPTPIVSRDNLTIPSEWYLYAQQQCAFASNFTSDGELSLSGRPLVPDFNFTETAGILVENEQFFTGFLFLMWARSDYRQFTRASARASDTDLQFNVDSNHLGLNGNVSFEFYNVLEYDPTLQLLFTGTDPGVDNPPQTETPQTIAINNENLSAGLIAAIAVPIVVVVACAVIIGALIVVSRRQASDRQLLARKLQQGQRAIKDSTHTGTEASVDPEAPPKTSRKSSQKVWVKSEKPTN
jgi:hypothetical protein